MKKTLISLGLAFLVLPLSASLPALAEAATIAELQAQLQVLMAQLTALQSQTTTPIMSPVSGTASCPNLARNLFRGSRGADVAQLQQFLISQNLLAADSATGFFGALTEAAVKQWQVKNSIASSGTPATTGHGAVGPRTRAALTKCTASVNTVSPTNTYTSPTDTHPTPTVPTTPTNPMTAVSCTALAAQTQTISCPTGQTGSIAQTRTSSCATGATSPTWGGWTTTSSSCATPAASSCTFSGRTIRSGGSVTAFQSGSISSGNQCSVETRRCSNGTLSGSYSYDTCTSSRAITPIPFYALTFTSTWTSHYYTSVLAEKDGLVSTYGFQSQGVTAWLLPVPNLPPGAVKWRMFYDAIIGTHFYTASDQEAQIALSSGTYTEQTPSEVAAVYPASSPQPSGTVPLYRGLDTTHTDYYYTTDANQYAAWTGSGVRQQGVVAYVYTASTTIFVPDPSSTVTSQVTDPPQTATYSGTKFGMMYSLWHCPVARTSPIYDNSKALAGTQAWVPIGQYSYWAQPASGYYCLTDSPDILQRHAETLRDAGIDFVYLDATNHAYTDEAKSVMPKQMITEPFAKMLDVWNRVPNAPKIVPWAPLTADSDMLQWMLGKLAQYPSLQFAYQGKQLALVADNPIFPASAAKVQQLSANTTVRTMWALSALPGGMTAQWSFLESCGDIAHSQSFLASGGTTPCNQRIFYNGTTLEMIPVGSSYHMGSASYAFSAVPKFHGKTFVQQFATAFQHPDAPLVLLASWNEFVGVRFCWDSANNSVMDPSKCATDHFPDGNKIFVDQYDVENNRDMEPTTSAPLDFYYRLMKNCIASFRLGRMCAVGDIAP